MVIIMLKNINKTRPDKGASIIDFPETYVVVDLETTGLNKYDDKIIEIGAIKYINGVESEKFHTYVNPQRHIPSAATNINGI